MAVFSICGKHTPGGIRGYCRWLSGILFLKSSFFTIEQIEDKLKKSYIYWSQYSIMACYPNKVLDNSFYNCIILFFLFERAVDCGHYICPCSINSSLHPETGYLFTLPLLLSKLCKGEIIHWCSARLCIVHMRTHICTQTHPPKPTHTKSDIFKLKTNITSLNPSTSF